MTPCELINVSASCLLVIDMQETLMSVMDRPEMVLSGVKTLVMAAVRLDVPVLASEQYPKGLGNTVSGVANLIPEGAIVEKIHFSCLGDDVFRRRFGDLARPQVIVAGVEAHVCVLQTVLDLLAGGHSVYLVEDAVSSRKASDRAAALARAARAGASIVTTEMVIFEWLGRAGTQEFKDLHPLVK